MVVGELRVVDIVKAVCSQAGSEKRNISVRELRLKLCDSRRVRIARFTVTKEGGNRRSKGRGACATSYQVELSNYSANNRP